MQKEIYTDCGGLPDTATQYGKSPTVDSKHFTAMIKMVDGPTPMIRKIDGPLPMIERLDESSPPVEMKEKPKPMIELEGNYNSDIKAVKNQDIQALQFVSTIDNSEMKRYLHEASKNQIKLTQLLLEFIGDNIKYISEWKKFIQWTGKIWKVVDTKEIEKIILDFIDTLPELSKALKLNELTKKFTNAGYYALVKDLREILAANVIKYENELDAAKGILCVENGIINLSTRKLLPHENFKESYITKIINVDYYPDFHYAPWDDFVLSIMSDNAEDALFLQKAHGYGLLGNPKEELSFVYVGDGSNGKSTLTSAIQKTLGNEYAYSLKMDALMNGGDIQNSEAPSPVMANLKDKLMVFASEAKESDYLNEAKFKHIVGLNNISARRLREDIKEFPITFVLYIDTNKLPKLHEADYAVFRRLAIVPFRRTFANSNKNVNLAEIFATDIGKQAILSWLVQGALRYQNEGLKFTKTVREATDMYIRRENSIGRFFEECIEEIEGNVETSEAVYGAYSLFCAENGLHTKTYNTFFKNPKFNNIEKIRTSTHRGYRGIKLIERNIKEEKDG